jgi:hypothetical protein
MALPRVDRGIYRAIALNIVLMPIERQPEAVLVFHACGYLLRCPRDKIRHQTGQ